MSLLARLSAVFVTCFWSIAACAGSCTLCLYGPDNMVFDRDGNMFLTDSDHKSRFRIIKLSKKGTKLREWHDFATVAGHENGPEGIAIAPNGNVLVTDGGALRVLVLSPDLRLLRTIGADGSTFHDLGHVAIDASGVVYISEGMQNRIQKFMLNGQHVATWQVRRGAASDELNMPQSIGVLPDGRLVVEDWRNRRIVIMASDGTPAFNFGGPGSASGKFENSSGLYVTGSGEILVAEQGLHRIQRFDSNGKWMSPIGNTSGHILFIDGPSAVASDSDGTLYSADGLTIVKFLFDGRLLSRWY